MDCQGATGTEAGRGNYKKIDATIIDRGQGVVDWGGDLLLINLDAKEKDRNAERGEEGDDLIEDGASVSGRMREASNFGLSRKRQKKYMQQPTRDDKERTIAAAESTSSVSVWRMRGEAMIS